MDNDTTAKKRCTKCRRVLPASTRYFTKRSKGNSYSSYCRGCAAGWTEDEFQRRILREILEARGYRQCNKCSKILPQTTVFFYTSNIERGGFENKCRGCRHCWTSDHFQLDILRERLLERGYKQCSKCGKFLPATLEHFYSQEKGLGGIKGHCKYCDWQVLKIHRATVGREHHLYIQRQYQIRNRDSLVQRLRDKYQRDKQNPAFVEWVRNDRRAWYHRKKQENPDWLYAFTHMKAERRRARKAGLPYDFSAKDRRAMFEYWQGGCVISGAKGKLTIDHWIPLTHAGADNPGTVTTNLVPMTKSLNSRKHNKPPAVWLRETFGEARAVEIEARIHAYFEWVRRRKAQQ